MSTPTQAPEIGSNNDQRCLYADGEENTTESVLTDSHDDMSD